jgi:hypothetical protein
VPLLYFPPFFGQLLFSKAALSYGIERRKIDGAAIKIYSPAKTVDSVSFKQAA